MQPQFYGCILSFKFYVVNQAKFSSALPAEMFTMIK